MNHILRGFCLLLGAIISLAAAQEEAAPLEVLEETAEYRVIRHVGGETRIPANPEQIVAMDTRLSDVLLALGIRPVGVTSWTGSDNINGFLPHVADELEGTAMLGEAWPSLNLEAVLAINPDLILEPGWLSENYDQLSSITPTVLFDSDDLEKRDSCSR